MLAVVLKVKGHWIKDGKSWLYSSDKKRGDHTEMYAEGKELMQKLHRKHEHKAFDARWTNITNHNSNLMVQTNRGKEFLEDDEGNTSSESTPSSSPVKSNESICAAELEGVDVDGLLDALGEL